MFLFVFFCDLFRYKVHDVLLGYTNYLLSASVGIGKTLVLEHWKSLFSRLTNDRRRCYVQGKFLILMRKCNTQVVLSVKSLLGPWVGTRLRKRIVYKTASRDQNVINIPHCRRWRPLANVI